MQSYIFIHSSWSCCSNKNILPGWVLKIHILAIAGGNFLQEEKQQPAPTAPTLLKSIHIPSQTFEPPNKNPKTNLTNVWDFFVGLFLLKNPPQVRNLGGRGRLHSCSCCSCSGIRWQSSTPTHRLVAQVSFIHRWYVFFGGTGWGLL